MARAILFLFFSASSFAAIDDTCVFVLDSIAERYDALTRNVDIALHHQLSQTQATDRLLEIQNEKNGIILWKAPTLEGGPAWLPTHLNQDGKVPVFPEDYIPGNAIAPKYETPSPRALFAAFPGRLVAVVKDRRQLVGKIEAVDGSLRTATVSVVNSGKRELLSLPLETIIKNTRGLTMSRTSDHHRMFPNPTSLPDGIRFPSLSSESPLLVDRKADLYLRDFLRKNVPKVRKNRSPSAKVAHAIAIVTGQIKYADEATASRWNKNRQVASRDNRARFVGDSLYYETGVCKDFALITAVLIHDAGVESRYVRGTKRGSPHGWIEYKNERGEWYALESQSGRQAPINEYGKSGDFRNYHPGEVTESEISEL